MKKKIFLTTVILLALLFFVACGKEAEKTPVSQNGGVENSKDERIVLTLGTVASNAALRRQVEIFNQENTEYVIEIREYISETILGNDGINTLQREILAGKGPDLINFDRLYTPGVVSKGITEDLSLYMEADKEFHREDYFSNILDAYLVNGKQYTLSPWFSVRTVAGTKEELGDISGWNMQELMEMYQRTGKSILMPGDSRAEVFSFLGMGSMGNFVNWEKGTCDFQGESFQALIAFCNLFPQYRVYEEDYSALSHFRQGDAFVYPITIESVYDTAKVRLIFGNREINYVGYPMDDKSGNIVNPGKIVLGINKNSNHKEEAWKFIKSFLSEEYQSTIEDGIPLLRSQVEQRLALARQPEYETDKTGRQVQKVKATSDWEGEESLEIFCITEQDARDFMEVITGAEAAYGVDYGLNDIVREEINTYFEEGKDLAMTLDTLQGRASVYMSENYQ